MRVLQITERFPPALGGVEGHVLRLATGLASEGASVEVLTTDLRRTRPMERLGDRSDSFPFPVRRCRAVKALELPHALGVVAPGMVRRALAGFWDVVHAHAYGRFPTFVGVLGRGLDGCALVMTPHADPGRPGLGKRAFDAVVPRLTLRRAERVIALSRTEAEYLVGLGVRRGRVAVVPNGVDSNEIAAGARGVRRDVATVLFVGRCDPAQKGLDVLVRALARVRPGSARLRIVGEDWGGHAVVRDLAHRLGVADRVDLVGAVSRAELLREYGRASVFVLPSHFDSFPLAVLEAMAAGLPVVATRVGGVPEVVVEGETGLLVPPGDPDALAEGLSRLLGDAGLRSSLGDAGRERARAYSWERTLFLTSRVYEDAVRERGS